MSVPHAFGHAKSKCNQTFQESSSHPVGDQQLLFLGEISGLSIYLTNEITAFGDIGEPITGEHFQVWVSVLNGIYTNL